MNAVTPGPLLFAEPIPSEQAIRASLDRAESEARLLRRQLRLSLTRQREARRLAEAGQVAGGPTRAT